MFVLLMLVQLHVLLVLLQGVGGHRGRHGRRRRRGLATLVAPLHAVEPVREHVGDRLGRALTAREVESSVAH